MSDNLIKNGSFNSQTFDHWSRGDGNTWKPTFVLHGKNDYALELPSREYAMQDILEGEQAFGKFSCTLDARASTGESAIVAAITGVTESGQGFSDTFLVGFLNTEWQTFTVETRFIENVRNCRLFLSVPFQDGVQPRQNIASAYIDNIKLYYTPGTQL